MVPIADLLEFTYIKEYAGSIGDAFYDGGGSAGPAVRHYLRISPLPPRYGILAANLIQNKVHVNKIFARPGFALQAIESDYTIKFR
jgi:hypothetical protein